MRIIFALILLVLAVCGYFRSGAVDSSDTEAGTGSVWHYSNTDGSSHGVYLLVHGLNLNPNRMNPLRDELLHAGFDVLQVQLTGHRMNLSHPEDSTSRRARLEAFRKVTLSRWMGEMQNVYRKAKARSEQQQVPLYYMGFSMGGLLGPLLLVSPGSAHFDKMVLLAPAIRLRPRSQLVRLLFLFPRLVIPSKSPERYRANSGTPVSAYHAMLKGMRELNHRMNQNLDIPTLVMMDTQDEFVSYCGLQHLMARQKLRKWKLIPIEKDKLVRESMYHHLIIDKTSLGPTAFPEMIGTIHSFLGGDF